MVIALISFFFFFFQAEDGIRDKLVTGVQTCALPDKDRFAVITYIKTLSPRWKEEKPEPPVVLPPPPPATPELLARGKELYVKAKCWECHGDTGRGDGPSADQLKDDLKFPIRPADFTQGQFKGGSHVDGRKSRVYCPGIRE